MALPNTHPQSIALQLKQTKLKPRIRIIIGLTLKTDVQYQMIKPEVGIELDIPDGMSADEAFDQTYEYLEEQLAKIVDKLQNLTGA